MNERRRQDRKLVTYFSRVIDRNNGHMLGYLVDLSEYGAQLVGDVPLKLHAIFNLRIDLPESFASTEHLDIDAEPVWATPDADPQFYRIGLQLVSIPESDHEVLQRLLREYSSYEA